MDERVGKVVGVSVLTVGILIEGLEHVEFIWRHVPKTLADMLDQRAVFFLILLGFVVLLIRARPHSEAEHHATTPAGTHFETSINDSLKQSVSAPATQIVNPVQTATSSATIEQHFHAPPPPITTYPPIAPVKQRELRPNIVFLGAKNISVNIDPEYRSSALAIYEREDGEYNALVASFRNEALSDSQVEPLFRVNSHLVFRDSDTREIGEGIANTHWLGEARYVTDLIPGGEARYLVLLLKGKKADTVATLWMRRTKGSGWGAGLREETFELPEFPDTIRLSLIANDGGLLYRVDLKTSLVEGRFVATVVQPQ